MKSLHTLVLLVILAGAPLLRAQTLTYTTGETATGTIDPDSHTFGVLNFNSTATAGSATINLLYSGILLNFFNTATAGSAFINTDLGTLSFNDNATAGSASITNSGGFINFNNGSTAGSASITNDSELNFNDTSNAGSAIINGSGGIAFYDSTNAGSASITSSGPIAFTGTSTAGSATITSNGQLQIVEGATAGSAAITNNSQVYFNDTATAGSASITNSTSGLIDIGGMTGGLNIGSLAGGGAVNLGSRALTLGGLNTSTTFSGAFADGSVNYGGTGGSLVKIGTGTLQLYGGSTYTGGTTINAGRLVAGGGFNDHSSLGTGAVTVNSGAILAGDDKITGLVTINSGGHLEPGDSTLPATGVLRFDGGLTLNGGAVLDFALGGGPTFLTMGTGAVLTAPSSGTVTINITDFGGFTADTYTLLDWSQGSASGLQLGDFVLGSTFSGYNFSLAINGSELDLVATTAAIPEPSTYAMFAGLGALGLAAFRRRLARRSLGEVRRAAA